MSPALSVLMPAYNVVDFVDGAVRSVLAQSFQDFEFIVIDDGSSDGTRERLRTLARSDRRIRLIEHARNLGLIDTLNEGLATARAPYVARMDADDLCAPQRLHLQMRALQVRPYVVVLGAQGWFLGSRHGLCRRPVGADACLRRLPFDNPLLHNAVLLRAQWLRDRGIAYRADARHAEDYDLWVQVVEHGGVIDNLGQPLVGYRIHAASVTQSNTVAQELAAHRIRARQWARAGVVFDGATEQMLCSRQFAPGWRLDETQLATLRHVRCSLRAAGYDPAEIGRFLLSVLPRARAVHHFVALFCAGMRAAPREVGEFAMRFAAGMR
jgi:hypothetical protein